jgi:hypothetical protein
LFLWKAYTSLPVSVTSPNQAPAADFDHGNLRKWPK